MKFTAEIQIIPLPEIFEPQGQTVLRHLEKLQIKGVNQMRIGKFVALELVAENESAAQETVEQICQKLLAHPLIETYNFQLNVMEDTIIEAPIAAAEEEVITDTSATFTSNSNEEE
ncbi:MAG: hypothetical protein Sapg2KO_15830 [Saprospiraceae bacterium]|mgnify:CR=1 FL=1